MDNQEENNQIDSENTDGQLVDEVVSVVEPKKTKKNSKAISDAAGEERRSLGKVLEEDKARDSNPQWYVVHTYSGYEDQVAESLKQRIESLDMKDKIFDIIVPKEKQIEIKGGKRKKIEKKIFPGYIMIKMIMTKNSWYVVRNTQNVTGFIGTGTDPVPINEDEVDLILQKNGRRRTKIQD